MNYKTQKFINKITFGLTEMGAGFDFADIWHNLKYGFRNLRLFFWIVWRWRSWDFVYSLALLGKGLEFYLSENEKCSYCLKEIDKTRIPKEKDIKATSEAIFRIFNEDYINMAEKKLNIPYPEEQMFDFEKVKVNEDGNIIYRMVDIGSKKNREALDKLYEMADTLEESDWNLIFDTMKNKGKTWWT